jgi:hypothetical protein
MTRVKSRLKYLIQIFNSQMKFKCERQTTGLTNEVQMKSTLLADIHLTF